MKIETIDNLEQSFELLQRENGIIGWYAHELAELLDYTDFGIFKQVVRRARGYADQAGFDSDKDFVSTKVNDIETYKLTRFAVLLCVMFADDKKPKVLQLKVLLAKFQDDVLTSYEIERIQERENLTHGEKYMTSVAAQHGLAINKMSWFKEAGFKGMYNMGAKTLKVHKGARGEDTIYNYMNLTETAANTFRTTQTAERIKNKNLYSPESIIKAAEDVGKEVREIVIANTGFKPENIPIDPNIKDVKKKIRQIRKTVQKIDSEKAKKKLSDLAEA